MRFSTGYTDIQSLAHRIRSGKLEIYTALQTDSRSPKRREQRFIAYILRGWETTEFCVAKDVETGKEWVLDGRRRTSAILDFLTGSLPLSGQEKWCGLGTRPHHGITYDDLPEEWRIKFKTYRIRILVASDFHDDELEVFLSHFQQFREHDRERDALGVVAGQIKEFAERHDPRKTLQGLLASRRRQGEFFKLLARALITLERRDLATRITSRDVSRFLIREQPANKADIETLAGALLLLDQTGAVASAVFRNLSSATFLSWLLFLIRAQGLRLQPRTSKELGVFLHYFESRRQEADAEPAFNAVKPGGVASLQLLFRFYKVSASAPLNAVPSSILRDAVIWILYGEFLCTNRSDVRLTHEMLSTLQDAFSLSNKLRDGTKIAKRLIALGWARF